MSYTLSAIVKLGSFNMQGHVLWGGGGTIVWPAHPESNNEHRTLSGHCFFEDRR